MTFKTAQAAFAQLLITGTLVHEAAYDDMRRALEIDANPNTVLVVSIDRYPELAVGMPIEWRIEIGRTLVQAIVKSISEPFLWVWTEEGIMAVLLELQQAHNPQLNLDKRPMSIVRKIQNIIDTQGFSVSVGIGSRYDNPYMLFHSYEEAKKSMVNRFFQGNRIVYQFDQETAREPKLTNPITPEEKMELLARVRIGDEEGSVNHLKILLERAAHSYKFNVDMFKSEALDLIMSLSRLAVDMGGDASEILSENARIIQSLVGTVRYNNFVSKLCDYWREIAKQVGQAGGFEASPIIRAAIKYIKENHAQKLTLKKMAEYCHVNAYYLAHLFKKETGMSCIDFLTKIRIEKSAFLLETTEMTVQQIAIQVGFQDANYFSRKFKKMMSCSPSSYREARLC
ncbi:helix-turn-helix domain-containing protein [Paenibacillus beijingensis]|uniref:AraC family transcriptional regulator n=1 Tax=Paenibacillus beijingensis TaxID=1126833 RepID=A0A0D5NEQ2_9BACL|nr:helix-turn-helix domain-containing protein [Paenibacillus beijingensis]AJY73403.1 AraC family transcriptional regulator [Paenibacillus beijingensis]